MHATHSSPHPRNPSRAWLRHRELRLRSQAWVCCVAGLTLGSRTVVGTTLIVLDGPGVGQSRLITAVGPGNGSIVLESPLDDWVIPVGAAVAAGRQRQGADRPSTVAVVSSFGSKIFAGNTFNW